MNGQATAIIPILKKLSETSGVASYALQALMKILCNNHEFREAETILIRILKSNSRDPAILATCAQFYQDALMPAQALRFLQKLTLICNSSPIFAFDFAAAYMALGDLAEATRVLLEWNARHPGNERVAAYLARLLIAEGREDEIERRVLLNKTAAKRLLDVWENVENPSTQASA